jgi:hypothetical protein
MFDLNGDGTLSKAEFKGVMTVLRRESPYANQQRKFTEKVHAVFYAVCFSQVTQKNTLG